MILKKNRARALFWYGKNCMAFFLYGGKKGNEKWNFPNNGTLPYQVFLNKFFITFFKRVRMHVYE